MDTFLLGAGANAPLGLPVAKGIFSEFNPADEQKKLFNALVKHLAEGKKGDLDLEEAIYLLENFVEMNKERREFKLIEKLVGEYDQKSSDAASHRTTNHIIRQTAQHAEGLLYSIKSYLWGLLRADQEKSFQQYHAIFSQALLNKNGSLCIFTTNYDLVLEDAFTDKSIAGIREHWRSLKIDDIYLGFIPKGGRFVFELDYDKPEESEIGIFKLHGSLDWDPEGESLVRCGAVRKPADLDAPALIYPGYKGTPDKTPFVELHNRFLNELLKAKRLIVIGFAFRDQHINSLINFALLQNMSLQVVAICPDLPADSGFLNLQRHFPKRLLHGQGRIGEIDLWDFLGQVTEQQMSAGVAKIPPAKGGTGSKDRK